MYSFKNLGCKVKEKGRWIRMRKESIVFFLALVEEKFDYVDDSC